MRNAPNFGYDHRPSATTGTVAMNHCAKVLRSTAVAMALGSVMWAGSAEAKPGTHAPSVSTWDSRASTIVPGAMLGFFSGGHLHFFSYNSNFTSTTGNLLAQFGIHYANYKADEATPTAHGLAGSAVAMFSKPLGQRYDNGVPKAALGFYIGGVPTVLISGQYNFLTIPAVFGLGVPLSPSKMITLTPFIEASPSMNLDTVINPYNLKLDPNVNPLTRVNVVTGEINFTKEEIEKIVNDAVKIDVSFAVGLRGGLNVSAHLNETVDLNLTGTMSSIGSAFKGPAAGFVGLNLVIRWDDIVPAVLPAERRVMKESCDVIEQRFQSCPGAKKSFDEQKHLNEELKKRDEDLKKKDDELKRKDELLKKKDDELKKLQSTPAYVPPPPPPPPAPPAPASGP